ncbi:MAG: hypothetical protein ACREVL_17475 [Solimonas sp.]
MVLTATSSAIAAGKHSPAYDAWAQDMWNRIGTASATNSPARGCKVAFRFDDAGYVTKLDLSECTPRSRRLAADAILNSQPFPQPPLEPNVPEDNTVGW